MPITRNTFDINIFTDRNVCILCFGNFMTNKTDSLFMQHKQTARPDNLYGELKIF